MLNHITIMGRLTRDPELRTTQAGVSVTSFTVAVDRDFGGRDGGERQTDFIDCVAWRVSGRLQSRKWQDRDGNNRTSWEVNADNVYFGESRRDGDSNRSYGDNRADSYSNNYSSNSGSYGGGYDSGRTGAPAPSNTFVDLDDGDGELPF